MVCFIVPYYLWLQLTHSSRNLTISVVFWNAVTRASTHASQGCDSRMEFSEGEFQRLQSTHPARDAISQGRQLVSLSRAFQFTHPFRDAITATLPRVVIFRLQPAHPKRVRCFVLLTIVTREWLQSTHPRMRFVEVFSCTNRTVASTHVPLVGCDIIGRIGYRSMLSSTHASYAGCDTIGLVLCLSTRYFNPCSLRNVV